MSTKTHRAEVYREHGWWVIRVPELDLVTQAEQEDEIELMARDVIAVYLDRDIDDVQVEIERSD